jgi:hypothetical protein
MSKFKKKKGGDLPAISTAFVARYRFYVVVLFYGGNL